MSGCAGALKKEPLPSGTNDSRSLPGPQGRVENRPVFPLWYSTKDMASLTDLSTRLVQECALQPSVLIIKAIIIDEGDCPLCYFFFASIKSQPEDISSHLIFKSPQLCCRYK